MRVADVGGSGPRIVLVHGFTQTAASWSVISRSLIDAGFEVVTVDAPGHGVASEVRADLRQGARRLRALGPAVFVGYSMGARFCLHLAMHQPEAIQALVLLGATPGIEDSAEREARRAADDLLADTIERDGVGPFLERWLAQPMFAGLPSDAPGQAERLTNTAAGLSSSLRLAGTGTQVPLWTQLHLLAAQHFPILLIAGERDEKFATIAARMHVALGVPPPVLIAGAGHAAHIERPADFMAALLAFLRESGFAD